MPKQTVSNRTCNLADRVYHFSTTIIPYNKIEKTVRVGNSEEPLPCDQFLKRNKKDCVFGSLRRGHMEEQCVAIVSSIESVSCPHYTCGVYVSLARRRELPKIAYTTHSEDKRQMFFISE